MAVKKKWGRPTKYREEYDEILIDHMSKGLSFESFGAVVDVYKEALYEWVKKHPSFANAKKTGSLKSQLFWEKIGISGTVGKINGFNNGSWIFNMKNRFNWADKHEVNQTGNSKIEIVIDKDDEQL